MFRGRRETKGRSELGRKMKEWKERIGGRNVEEGEEGHEEKGKERA